MESPATRGLWMARLWATYLTVYSVLGAVVLSNELEYRQSCSDAWAFCLFFLGAGWVSFVLASQTPRPMFNRVLSWSLVVAKVTWGIVTRVQLSYTIADATFSCQEYLQAQSPHLLLLFNFSFWWLMSFVFVLVLMYMVKCLANVP